MSSSDDEASEGADFEQDLMVLDAEQAELIRSINKMGSMASNLDRSNSRFS